MVDVYIEAIKGVNKSYVEYIDKRVIEQNGDRVYTLQEIDLSGIRSKVI